MTKKLVPGGILAALAAVGCGTSNKTNGTGTGSFDLNLAIPDGRTVSTIDLSLVCPDSFVNQTHTLNVANGDVVATFGGLAPGGCTATLSTVTGDGYNCQGSAMFTVVAGQIVPVPVTLTCQGTNTTPSGGAKITAGFGQNTCAADRIQKLFAIPSNVLTGQSTKVELELNTANVVGTAVYSWAVRNDATHTGQGTLASGTCSPNSASCQMFTCTGLGASPTTDPRSGLPAAGVYVSVTVEDSECFDTEEVLVDCLQSSVCGDGTREGAEACDDGNTASNDGCTSGCIVERCGDGVIQSGIGEQCDGMVGVGPNQGCSATCQLINNPFCGDGMVNQMSEQCDGTAGLLSGQVCGAPTSGSTACRIIPTCHNNHVEAGETCDTGPDSATCVNCQAVTVNVCDQCISGIAEIGEYNNTVCKNDPLCNNARQCIQDNPSCWTSPVPLACFCGSTQAQLDSCEMPTFVPAGPCAGPLKAGAGAGAANVDVTNRYFDLAFPSGAATLIIDSAFSSCRTQCFP
jgi:cysteine-rich repeat protein